MSEGYTPEPIRGSVGEISQQIYRELLRVSSVLETVRTGYVPMSYVAPTKPREGMIRLADGTQWNPGSGAGVYCYYSGSWNRLG